MVEQIDERYSSKWFATWILGSVKHITSAGAKSATYLRPSRALGIVGDNLTLRPVGESLLLLSKYRGKKILETHSSHPLIVDSLIFPDSTALVWNYTNATQQIEIDTAFVVLAPYEVRIIPLK